MALGAGQAARLGPASVAVHHDRHVSRQPLGLDAGRSGPARVRYGRRGRTGPAASGRVLGHVSDNSEVPTYRDEAVVLRTHKLGEADRIITMLSRGHGKVRAVAKGVRRTSSKFGARLEPFSHVDLQFAEGRTLDVVTQVESLHAFGEPLTSDYPGYTAGQAMLETADRLVPEVGEPALQQYLLLVGALKAWATAPVTDLERRR